MIQHRPHFRIMIAASHTLDEIERWASFLVNVQTVHISFLSEGEARQLIERPVRNFPLNFEPEACHRVLELTSGHPFLVQLVCATLVDLKNEQPASSRRFARRADVEAAIPRSLERGSFFFADIQRNQVDDAGRAALQLMASHRPGTPIPLEDLHAWLPDPSIVAGVLARLVQRELVECAPGGYRFRAEIVQRWFGRTQLGANLP
jgi:hypothetical protein